MRVGRFFFNIILIVNILLIDFFILFPNGIIKPGMLDGRVSNFIETVVITANFITVIYIYKKDEKKYIERRKTESYNYWYHDVLIKNNMHSIQELFSLCLDNYDKVTKDNIKQSIREVKEKKKEIENVFGYMLKAYDKQLYDKFYIKLFEFEDTFTEAFNDVIKKKSEKNHIKVKIRESEINVISVLMRHDLGSNRD